MCERCQRIFSNVDIWDDRTHQNESHLLHDVSTLKSCGSAGCHMCALVSNSIMNCPMLPNSKFNGIPDEYLRVYWYMDDDKVLRFIIEDEIEDQRWTLIVLNLHQVYEFDNALLANTSQTWISERNLAFAEKCFTQCLSNHARCRRSNGDTALPTRLLELGISKSNPSIRLRLSEDLPSGIQYATLSHCWGTIPMFKLTRSNLASLQTAIAFEDLCKTFQDTVRLARRFGIKYLWIDSLYIVQDDEEDWSLEAGKMSIVYGQSILNIAATAATDGSKGLHFPRDATTVPICRVETSRGTILDYATGDDLYNDVHRSPLSRRAWVFQERFLASRTLHCASLQLVWECTELRASESFPKECPFFLGRVASLAGHRITDPIKFWGEVLREYSSGQLTQSGDKLLALSGVAKWMESQTHDTYLAGLWKNDIEWQLTWLISPSTRRGRPLQYRAPSWSWSAVDGHVNLSSFVDRFLIELTLNVSVLNISITYKAVDVFGLVENGNLRMECGKMKRACQDTNRSIFESYISPLCLDTLDDDVNESCFYLPVYMTPKYVYSTLSSYLVDKISMQGLVLQKTGNKQGEYRRIGGFEGREGAIGAYEAVSEDDAETTDYESFVDENFKRYFPYTITII